MKQEQIDKYVDNLAVTDEFNLLKKLLGYLLVEVRSLPIEPKVSKAFVEDIAFLEQNIEEFSEQYDLEGLFS